MPTEIKELVYKYDELPEDVKEKVLEKHWDINVDSDYWYDYDGKTGFTSAEIKKYHLNFETSDEVIDYKDMYFDIDRGQYIQFTDVSWHDEENARRYLGLTKRIWERVYFSFVNVGRNGTTRLNWEWDYDYAEPTKHDKELLERAQERFDDKMQEALKGLSNTWDYQTSREAIEETIRINEYLFDLNGNIRG